MKKRLFLVVAFGILSFLGIDSARAGVLIYELSFSNIGRSVNYSFLEDEYPGYLVVDQVASTFSSVVVEINPTTRVPFSTTGVLAGTYATMLSLGDSNNTAVAYSSSAGTVSGNSTTSTGTNLSLQVIGNTENNVNIGGKIWVPVAKSMTGFLLASAPQSGNVTITGIPSASGNFTYGFAGSSKVTAKYQSDLTKSANKNKLDVPGTLTALTLLLQKDGISPAGNSTTSNSTISLGH